MPEGPEIRRAADKIAKVVEGKFIEVVGFSQPAMQRYEDDFTGQTVTCLLYTSPSPRDS